MASSSRAAALVALATTLAGCVSGHLVALGRRRAYATAVDDVRAGDGGVVVAYAATVTDDDGVPVAKTERWAFVEAGSGRVRPRLAPPVAGPAVPSCDAALTCCADVLRRDGRDEAVRVRMDGTDVTVPLARLTTSWTAPWVYPLLPVTMAVDTVAVPFLVLNLPMVLVVGD